MRYFIFSFLALLFSATFVDASEVNESKKELSSDSVLNHATHYIPDDPFLEMLDSLSASNFFEASPIQYETSFLNIHQFPLDSIPVYSDSIYKARMEALHDFSPIQYCFNDKIKRHIELYSKHRRLMLAKVMGLSQLYFPMFEEELDKENLPLELKYVPIVESALNNTARSRAGAVGMWQFMYRTGTYLGLEVNSYIDERRDPLKATKTAIKYLKYLHGLYDNWLLALAAYNAGHGNVNKAIRRAGGTKNFWAISAFLPKETQNYIPSFMAVSYLMNHSADHNIYPLKPKFDLRNVDTVHIKQAINFEQIADVLCVPYQDIVFLNPQYKRGYVPIKAGDSARYSITLPLSMIGDFVVNEQIIYNYKLSKKADEEVNMYANKSQVIHRVRKGESVGLIAQRYNVRVSDVRGWNGLSSRTYIYPGQKLVIFSKSETATARGYALKKEEVYKGYLYYTIRSGDTLWDIAKKYQGVSADDIIKLNRISSRKVLKPGMKIKIKSTSI